MLKAYKCTDDYTGFCTVIFAETAGKARYIAIMSDTIGEDLTFKDIYVRRVPALDGAYRGRKEMDWYDPEDRLAMVKIAGFYCDEDGFDPDLCEKCSAKDFCDRYNDYLEEELKRE